MAKKSGKRKTLRKNLVSKERAIATTSPARKKQSTPEIIPDSKTLKKSIGDYIFITNPKELRNSIHSIRDWSAQMRGTMIQMEQTLDTLTNLIGMYERWQGSRKTKQLTANGILDKNGQSFLKMLKSIDFQQILTILNSPLLQALMELNDAEEEENNQIWTEKKDHAIEASSFFLSVSLIIQESNILRTHYTICENTCLGNKIHRLFLQ